MADVFGLCIIGIVFLPTVGQGFFVFLCFVFASGLMDGNEFKLGIFILFSFQNRECCCSYLIKSEFICSCYSAP